MTTAHEILLAGIGHMQDRAATYDKPEGERSMVATVAAFNAVTGISLTEEQGWMFLLLLKAVRSQQGAFKLDSYEDGAAYFGLMGEAAANSLRNPSVDAVDGCHGKLRAKLCWPHMKPPAGEQPMKYQPKVDPIGVDVRFDQSGRQEAVEQNGNTGEHYDAQANEPERPRHLCQTCAQGHATHECTAGQEAIPLGELAIQQGGKEDPQLKSIVDEFERVIEFKPKDAKPSAELPPTDHLVDPTGKPLWKDAPHWACYLTQDANGVWKWWHKKPAVMGSRWQGVGMLAEVNSGDVVGRWQDSFECAPGLTVGAEA